jgi:hypothetical protein
MYLGELDLSILAFALARQVLYPWLDLLRAIPVFKDHENLDFNRHSGLVNTFITDNLIEI